MRSGRTTYATAGWHLAVHLENHLSDEALDDLAQLQVSATSADDFGTALLRFLGRELPGWMALVPRRRYTKFLEGILSAIEEGRFPRALNPSTLAATSRSRFSASISGNASH